MKFIVEIRDYEQGDRPLTVDMIESQIATMLDNDDSEGTVIVTQEEE